MEKPLAFVIEDDKHLAAAFGEALEDAGYQTEILFDGKAAMEQLAQATPVTLVLDLNIPYVKGTDILTYIRSEPRLKGMRIIVATADDRTADQVTGLANLILLKPVGYQQLRDLSARYKPKTA